MASCREFCGKSRVHFLCVTYLSFVAFLQLLSVRLWAEHISPLEEGYLVLDLALFEVAHQKLGPHFPAEEKSCLCCLSHFSRWLPRLILFNVICVYCTKLPLPIRIQPLKLGLSRPYLPNKTLFDPVELLVGVCKCLVHSIPDSEVFHKMLQAILQAPFDCVVVI